MVSTNNNSSGRYCDGDLSAWHEMDGYTCYLGYKDLTITLMFHGQLSYDFDHKATLNEFNQIVATTCAKLEQ